MNIIKQKFNALEKREQYILLVGAAFVVFYLLYGVLYSGLAAEKDKYRKRVVNTEETLIWMGETVQTIKTLQKQGMFLLFYNYCLFWTILQFYGI